MPRHSLAPATGHAPRQASGAGSSFASPGTPLALPRIAPDGTFTGYASLFERPDLSGDSIAPGAFRESLARRGAGAVRMLFQHDCNQPIGVWQKVFEDRQGLYVQGRLVLEVDRAREVLALLRAGALDGLSIGFRALAGRRDARTGLRRLTRIDLWEISIVTFPLLPGARIGQVKACSVVAALRAATQRMQRDQARCARPVAG